MIIHNPHIKKGIPMHQETRDNYERFVAAYQAGQGPQPLLKGRRRAAGGDYGDCDPTAWSDNNEYIITFDGLETSNA